MSNEKREPIAKLLKNSRIPLGKYCKEKSEFQEAYEPLKGLLATVPNDAFDKLRSQTNTYGVPIDHNELRKLADEFVEWAKSGVSDYIDDFPIQKNLSPFKFKRNSDEYFQDRYELALYIISNRREKSAAQNNMNTVVWKTTHTVYNKDFRELNEKKLEQNYEEAKKLIVMMKEF